MSIFGDFKIDGSTLVAKETGAEIPLTTESARDALRIASFVWMVNAVRASRAVKRREPRARISFFPNKPRSYYAIWPVCQLADVKIVDDPQDANLHFYFEDRDHLTEPHPTPSHKPAINVNCFDIRKSVVSRIFEETFGYGYDIDPTTYCGEAVEKSEANGLHDGRIIQCPINARRKNRVYQKLIDNTFDGADHVDLRTSIVGRRIPFVMIKRRRAENRFVNDNYRVDLIDTDAVLSKSEQSKIIEFAGAMGLQFGGLDVLRNRTDGRIYIVDVNKTDMGPPSAMSGPDKLKAMRGLAAAFAQLVDEIVIR